MPFKIEYCPGYQHTNKYGILTYLEKIPHDKYHMAKWKCHCDNEWITSVNAIISNNTKSCGKCNKKELQKLIKQSIRYCKHCNQDKENSEFTPSELINYYPKCRSCVAVYSKKYYDLNREQQIQKTKDYDKNNKEKILLCKKQYRINNKEKIAKYNKKYNINKKDELNKKRNERQIKRRRVDPSFRLRQNISFAVNNALKKLSCSKEINQSILNYLPFSMSELVVHLERLFAHSDNLDQNKNIWMNWGNQGKYVPSNYKYLNGILINYEKVTWQLDHIIPQSNLPYTSMEDDNFKKCWSLENLRPLRADINIIEGVNKIRH